MLIGELAERAGTSTRALRYYEAQGLLEPARAGNGYRTYAESELLVVREIRTLLEIGFGLDDIRPFIACLRAGNPSGDSCPDSVGVLRRKLVEVDALVAHLGAIRAQVQAQLAAAQDNRETPWY